MTINRIIKPIPAINCTQPSPEGFKFLFTHIYLIFIETISIISRVL